MSQWRALGGRWLRFNAVGLIGVLVQLAALVLFRGVLGIGYLLATALAVETAVLHNFAWHERWTWQERTRAASAFRLVLGRLLRFHLGNGLVSIVSNLAVMRLLAGHFGLHYLAANLVSIAAASLANFLVGEYFVFRKKL